MSQMKRFAEEVSIEMGLGGEITEAVMREAQRRLDSGVLNQTGDEALARQAASEHGEEQCHRQGVSDD